MRFPYLPRSFYIFDYINFKNEIYIFRPLKEKSLKKSCRYMNPSEEKEEEIFVNYPNNNFINFYPNFDEISITTVTGYGLMDGMVHTSNIFNIIPIHKLPPLTGKVLPKIGNKGAVISVRQTGRPTRGLIRGGSFKNCVMLDVSYSLERNLSCKLSKNTIHITGALSEEMCYEGFDIVANMINSLQDKLDFIQQNQEEALEVVDHIENKTKGEPILVEEELLHKLIPSTPQEEWSEIHLEIYNFLIYHFHEFEYYEDLTCDINNIIRLQAICDKRISILEKRIAMVNVNYNLYFTINLFEMAKRINGFNGFYCRFDNSIDHCATVERRYTNEKDVARKDVKKITFLIYKCGVVTQSGPGKIKNREAYYKFIETIHIIKPYIIENNPIKMKSIKGGSKVVNIDKICHLINEEYERLKDVSLS